MPRFLGRDYYAENECVRRQTWTRACLTVPGHLRDATGTDDGDNRATAHHEHGYDHPDVLSFLPVVCEDLSTFDADDDLFGDFGGFGQHVESLESDMQWKTVRGNYVEIVPSSNPDSSQSSLLDSQPDSLPDLWWAAEHFSPADLSNESDRGRLEEPISADRGRQSPDDVSAGAKGQQEAGFRPVLAAEREDPVSERVLFGSEDLHLQISVQTETFSEKSNDFDDLLQPYTFAQAQAEELMAPVTVEHLPACTAVSAGCLREAMDAQALVPWVSPGDTGVHSPTPIYLHSCILSDDEDAVSPDGTSAVKSAVEKQQMETLTPLPTVTSESPNLLTLDKQSQDGGAVAAAAVLESPIITLSPCLALDVDHGFAHLANSHHLGSPDTVSPLLSVGDSKRLHMALQQQESCVDAILGLRLMEPQVLDQKQTVQSPDLIADDVNVAMGVTRSVGWLDCDLRHAIQQLSWHIASPATDCPTVLFPEMLTDDVTYLKPQETSWFQSFVQMSADEPSPQAAVQCAGSNSRQSSEQPSSSKSYCVKDGARVEVSGESDPPSQALSKALAVGSQMPKTGNISVFWEKTDDEKIQFPVVKSPAPSAFEISVLEQCGDIDLGQRKSILSVAKSETVKGFCSSETLSTTAKFLTNERASNDGCTLIPRQATANPIIRLKPDKPSLLHQVTGPFMNRHTHETAATSDRTESSHPGSTKGNDQLEPSSLGSLSILETPVKSANLHPLRSVSSESLVENGQNPTFRFSQKGVPEYSPCPTPDDRRCTQAKADHVTRPEFCMSSGAFVPPAIPNVRSDPQVQLLDTPITQGTPLTPGRRTTHDALAIQVSQGAQETHGLLEAWDGSSRPASSGRVSPDRDADSDESLQQPQKIPDGFDLRFDDEEDDILDLYVPENNGFAAMPSPTLDPVDCFLRLRDARVVTKDTSDVRKGMQSAGRTSGNIDSTSRIHKNHPGVITPMSVVSKPADRSEQRLVVVNLIGEFLRALEDIENQAAPQVQRLKAEGAVKADVTFLSMTPDYLRFLVKDRSNRQGHHHPEEGGCEDELCDCLEMVYTLRTAAHLLQHSCLESAILHLSASQGKRSAVTDRMDILRKALFQHQFVAQQGGQLHPKVAALCREIQNHRHLLHEPCKVLVVLRHDQPTLAKTLQSAVSTDGVEAAVLKDNTVAAHWPDDCQCVLTWHQPTVKALMEDATLVLEFQADNDSPLCCTCRQHHVNYLGLAIQGDTQEVQPEVRGEGSADDDTITIVGSPHLIQQQQLLQLLETRHNLVVVRRDYASLGVSHYPDVLVSCHRGCVVLQEGELTAPQSLERLTERLAALGLHLATVWVVLHCPAHTARRAIDRSTMKKVVQLQALTANLSAATQGFPATYKVLLCATKEDIAAYINYLARSHLASGKSAGGNGEVIHPPADVSKEEEFLLCVPCLNPFSCHLLLSRRPLGQLMSLSRDQLAYLCPELAASVLENLHCLLNLDRGLQLRPQTAIGFQPVSADRSLTANNFHSTSNAPTISTDTAGNIHDDGSNDEENNTDIAHTMSDTHPYNPDSHRSQFSENIDLQDMSKTHWTTDDVRPKSGILSNFQTSSMQPMSDTRSRFTADNLQPGGLSHCRSRFSTDNLQLVPSSRSQFSANNFQPMSRIRPELTTENYQPSLNDAPQTSHILQSGPHADTLHPGSFQPARPQAAPLLRQSASCLPVPAGYPDCDENYSWLTSTRDSPTPVAAEKDFDFRPTWPREADDPETGSIRGSGSNPEDHPLATADFSPGQHTFRQGQQSMANRWGMDTQDNSVGVPFSQTLASGTTHSLLNSQSPAFLPASRHGYLHRGRRISIGLAQPLRREDVGLQAEHKKDDGSSLTQTSFHSQLTSPCLSQKSTSSNPACTQLTSSPPLDLDLDTRTDDDSMQYGVSAAKLKRWSTKLKLDYTNQAYADRQPSSDSKDCGLYRPPVQSSSFQPFFKSPGLSQAVAKKLTYRPIAGTGGQTKLTFL